MTGIQFVTDDKGRKVAVLIDLKKHGPRLQDFWDGLVSESRRKEKGIPLAKVKADLIKAGGCVGRYVVEIKPSARKELESLPDHVLRHVITKLESSVTIRDSPAARSLRLQRPMAHSHRRLASGVHHR